MAAGLVAISAFGAVMGPAPARPVHGPLATASAAAEEPIGVTVPRTVTGTLRVTAGCAVLRTDDGAAGVGEALLVWPAGSTRWHPRQGLVTVDRPGGGVAILGSGDRVWVAGGESRDGGGGLPAGEWEAEVDWVSPPADGCVGDRRVWVADITAV